MDDLGEAILVALADQGFGIVITEEDVRIWSRDRLRLYIFPEAPFNRNAYVYRLTLEVIVIGLMDREGFVPPPLPMD